MIDSKIRENKIKLYKRQKIYIRVILFLFFFFLIPKLRLLYYNMCVQRINKKKKIVILRIQNFLFCKSKY